LKNKKFNDIKLTKFIPRKYLPKVSLLECDKFFRICFAKKNTAMGKIFLFSNFCRNFFSWKFFNFSASKNILPYFQIMGDSLQRIADEVGIAASRINQISIDEFILFLNYIL